MILRILSASARVAILLVAVCLGVAISYDSIRNARAAHYVGLQTAAGFERATQLEPGGAHYWYLLGRYWQYNMEQPDPRLAIQAYRRALSMSPGYADAWLDLATAYEGDGDLDLARHAYLRARNVYPSSAEVAWRYGNFLLRQGDMRNAFAEIRASITADHSRAPEAFSRCLHSDPDVEDLLNRVLPPLSDVYIAVLRDLSLTRDSDSASHVWARLVALHQPITLYDAYPYVDALLYNGRLGEARAAWAQAVNLSGALPVPDPPGSVVWDAGFESRKSGGGFTWRLPADKDGVEAVLDGSHPHSGTVSLRLSFDGKSNVYYHDVCQRLVLQPSVTYDFSAWVRTKALTTDQGVRFMLFVQGSPPFTSPELHGTHPWTNLKASWTVSPATQQAFLCVGRNPSDQDDDKIQGIAWVDDVSMVPQSSGNGHP